MMVFEINVPNIQPLYMAKLCRRIFSSSSSKTQSSPIDLVCLNWFVRAFKYCTNKLKDQNESDWANFDMSKAANHPPFNQNISSPNVEDIPIAFSTSGCVTFFSKIAEDYINFVPKYIISLHDSIYSAAILFLLLGLVFLLLMYLMIRHFFSMAKKRAINKIKKRMKLYLKKKNNKFEIEFCESLKTHMYEIQHLKVQKPLDPLNVLFNDKTFIIQVNKFNFAEAVNLLIKYEANSMIESQNNKEKEDSVNLQKKATEKIISSLRNTSCCRFIIEFNANSDEDMQNVESIGLTNEEKPQIFEHEQQDQQDQLDQRDQQERQEMREKPEPIETETSRTSTSIILPHSTTGSNKSSNLRFVARLKDRKRPGKHSNC